jgi:hydrogenase maturation factor
LLIVLPGDEAERLVLQLRAGGVEEAAIIGEITDAHPGKILVEK